MHIVQSPEWGKFKSECGTPAIKTGNVQYTKHKVPFTSFYYGYAPKVNPLLINWNEIKKSAKDNNCITINFDVPNVLTTEPNSKKAIETLEEHCRKSPKDTFARHNVLLDISQDEKTLLSNLHHKHRYNIKYAKKSGVSVEKAESGKDFDVFFNLLKETSDRQKYYIHPKAYFQKIWQILGKNDICNILTAKYKSEPLVSWMLFTYEDIIYYPYGGSTVKHKNLHPSCLIGWETILLGKKKGCKTFDMWGASENPDDKFDPWHGFTNFKLKYGGKHVEYINSYDLILNEPAYSAFSIANNLRWKLLNLLK